MATIKPIEGRSIHQIQSGQVIVDLCSVVKELVENSLDAGSSSLDVRFKNNGLESIEVQDNGAGISPEDYETIALKHYTSKLSTYNDLSSLDTFGFRGEALSSLCALSKFHIVTARDGEAPKGKRLDFEESGKLKATSVAACPKGTTVAVEELFHNLPVRRRELEKHVKREYNKVLAILHAYACAQTKVKFTVSNQPTKGKKAVVFGTKSNPTTKENIANVYGAKTLSSLIPLNLRFELQPTTSQVLKENKTDDESTSREVLIVGHISRPVFGEGRQTPDRQMFFVNSRPCGLPQIAKAFNEVYKSYNITQSPFVFADLKIDTNAYDVNVSPDKRVIMLHDQAALLESLKQELTNMFAAEEQTVPQSQLPMSKLPAYRPLTVLRESSMSDNNNVWNNEKVTKDDQAPSTADTSTNTDSSAIDQLDRGTPTNLIEKFASRNVGEREGAERPKSDGRHTADGPSMGKQKLAARLGRQGRSESPVSTNFEGIDVDDVHTNIAPVQVPRAVQDFNDRIASQQEREKQRRQVNSIPERGGETSSSSTAPDRTRNGSVEAVFNNVHPNRTPRETTATVTMNDKATTAVVGSQPSKRRKISEERVSQFASSLQAFAAPGSRVGGTAQKFDTVEENNEVESIEESGEASAGSFVHSDEDSQSETEGSVDANSADDDRASTANAPHEDSDPEYIDEAEKKRREELRVQDLIHRAESKAAEPSQENQKRASTLLKGVLRKDATVNLARTMNTSVSQIANLSRNLEASLERCTASADNDELGDDIPETLTAPKQTEEERLSLTISKSDFATMRIAGQFNLGFILAVRSNESPPKNVTSGNKGRRHTDDLFIIDQHASSEIHTFSMLSASTTFPPQPLVQPVTLDLTAIEEETILAHKDGALLHNGFVITMDLSGDRPVGRRCDLRALPTSKETVFDARDLEELLSILCDYPASSASSEIPRPSKHRRTLAMRACRSSIMVGKELSRKMMERVVEQMGEIDRPWNCPHGRPTMRHLAGLGAWKAWREDEGLVDGEDGALHGVDWASYVGAAIDRGPGVATGTDNEGEAEEDAHEDTDDEESEGVAEEKADESDEDD